MLILSRKVDEQIVIDGRIIVKIFRIGSDFVKIGIQAPEEMPVYRQEVFDMIQKNKKEQIARESTQKVSVVDYQI